ncbi:hypothetical protein ACE6H2_006220 [Prunus campanulata]
MVSKAKLMIAADEKIQGKALTFSHTKTAICTIKDKFSRQQLQRFKDSCFGHLLVIEDLKWTTQIIHGLLLRKADPRTVSQVNGIKFIVGNKVIQFTAQQFCVITGLQFGKLPFIPTATNDNCSLKKKYFCNNKTVSLSELEQAFIDCSDEEDVFKFGLLYFAVFIWAFEVFPAFAALHIVVREQNAQVPRILQWRINSLPRFHEVMSQVFENAEVDVQPLRPSVIEKQQPYWSWGDDVDDTEEVVELFGDDEEPKTSTSASVQEKDEDIAEIASLPSSSKASITYFSIYTS